MLGGQPADKVCVAEDLDEDKLDCDRETERDMRIPSAPSLESERDTSLRIKYGQKTTEEMPRRKSVESWKCVEEDEDDVDIVSCLSTVAITVYIILGVAIVVLLALNLIYGFHLVFFLSLIVVIFILITLLTDNIGIYR